MTLSEDLYLQKIYGGLLGKVTGVILGAPLENTFWTYDQIKNAYGEITSYVRKYKQFAADDDINGPLFIIRVIDDIFRKNGTITSKDVGNIWLNYISSNRGMIWWGGYGKSTEQTAYENILSGIKPPVSGSIQKNGKPLAEQIGGQIFVDTWGLVFPNEPDKSSYFASLASSVSHDGEALEGAKFVAAAVSSAFSSDTIENVFIKALSYVSKDSEYFKILSDVYHFYKKNPTNWREAFEYLLKIKYNDDLKYPGPVHIIPNAGIVALSLLYGEGDFSKSICIATMCGMDTDCNAGNVGCILGVFKGPEGISETWKSQINDSIICSSSMGSLNIIDLPTISRYIGNLNRVLHGEENAKENEINLDFQFVGSTHGFKTNHSEKILMRNIEDPYDSKNRCLQLILNETKGYTIIDLYRSFFYIPSDLDDEKYGPMFSPTIYSGQEISCRILPNNIPNGTQLIASLYAKTANNKELISEMRVHLNSNEWQFLKFSIPDSEGEAIKEVGIRIYIQGKNNYYGPMFFDDFKISGKVDYYIDFSKQPEEFGSVRQFSFNKGAWRNINGVLDGTCSDFGSIYTGNFYWKNYDFSTTITPIFNNNFGIIFRCRGNLNYYLLKFAEDNVSLEKHTFEGKLYLTNKVMFKTLLNNNYNVRIIVKEERITVFLENQKIFDIFDENPIVSGCVGYMIFNGTRITINKFSLKEI